MSIAHESFDSTLQHYVYRCPYGLITIQATSTNVTRIVFGDQQLSGPRKPNALTNLAANQLMEYFAGKRMTFELPLSPGGTAFQKEVWEEVQRIPYGQSLSISEIAANLGKEESYRVVGTATKKNPLAIVIPTHRIVAAPGRKLNATKAVQLNAALLLQEQRNLGI